MERWFDWVPVGRGVCHGWRRRLEKADFIGSQRDCELWWRWACMAIERDSEGVFHGFVRRG